MIQFLFRLAKALAAQFGPSCEVVIHDLQSNDPDSSIVAIENGHVSGRKVGDGPSHVVLEALNSGGIPEDRLSYLTKTADGKTLKSTTVYIRDEGREPIGIFSINYDITLMLAMEENLRQFTAPALQQADDRPERPPDLLHQEVGEVAVLLHLLQENVILVELLHLGSSSVIF